MGQETETKKSTVVERLTFTLMAAGMLGGAYAFIVVDAKQSESDLELKRVQTSLANLERDVKRLLITGQRVTNANAVMSVVSGLQPGLSVEFNRIGPTDSNAMVLAYGLKNIGSFPIFVERPRIVITRTGRENDEDQALVVEASHKKCNVDGRETTNSQEWDPIAEDIIAEDIPGLLVKAQKIAYTYKFSIKQLDTLETLLVTATFPYCTHPMLTSAVTPYLQTIMAENAILEIAYSEMTSNTEIDMEEIRSAANY